MFKTIFWNKEYPNVLISFINSILKRKDPIKSVELINTEMDTQFIGEHGIRLDLVAKTSAGEILNVEMQKKNNDDMYKRSLFYWAKIYSSQLKTGQYYKDLNPVIAINILDFVLFKNDNDCHRSFVLKNTKTNEEYLRMLEIHFVELNKRKYMDQNDELWAWTEFLKAPNSSNLNEKRIEINSLYDAQAIFNKANSNSIEREKMRLLDKTQMDNLSAISYAKAEGLAEGLEKGEQKGKLEEQKQIALNMKNHGLEDVFIAKCLNISIYELKQLLNN
jgi:predicted transposase/invertase (TIGR01784 family)